MNSSRPREGTAPELKIHENLVHRPVIWPSQASRTLSVAISFATCLALTGCSKIDGSYRGSLQNQSYGVTADVFISLKESDDIVTGNMTIGAPLHGGGQIQGRRDHKNIEFTTSDGMGGRIAWIGSIEGKRIEGHYVVEPGGLNLLLNGNDKQQGIWAVSR